MHEESSFAAKYAATISLWRQPGALVTYMSKLSGAPLTAQIALPHLRRFVSAVLNDKFAAERYSSEGSRHLSALSAHLPAWTQAGTVIGLVNWAPSSLLFLDAPAGPPTPMALLQRALLDQRHLDERVIPRTYALLSQGTLPTEVVKRAVVNMAAPGAAISGLQRSFSSPSSEEIPHEEDVADSHSSQQAGWKHPDLPQNEGSFATNRTDTRRLLSLEKADFGRLLDSTLVKMARIPELSGAADAIGGALALVSSQCNPYYNNVNHFINLSYLFFHCRLQVFLLVITLFCKICWRCKS
jgi:hypothetical protein